MRWNAASAGDGYALLLRAAGIAPGSDPAATLADRLDAWVLAAGLPRNLAAEGIGGEELAALADEAAEEWTGRFNPRPFDAAGALALYRSCA